MLYTTICFNLPCNMMISIDFGVNFRRKLDSPSFMCEVGITLSMCVFANVLFSYSSKIFPYPYWGGQFLLAGDLSLQLSTKGTSSCLVRSEMLQNIWLYIFPKYI